MAWKLSDVHHIGLTVSDIERSIEFYRDVLGMELVGRRPRIAADYVARQTGYEAVELSVASFRVNSDSRQSLEVAQYLTHAGSAADTATHRPGNAHFCFLVDNLRECYDELRRQNVRFKSEPVEITAGPNEGGLVVYFFDPDDHVFELFQPPA